MGFSELKYKIDIIKAKHKYELDKLRAEQEKELKALIDSCKHKYEDGTSARVGRGDQRDWWYVCDICNKEIG